MQSITELSKLDGRVYVYLSSDEIGEAFLQQAEKEGFTFCDGVKPTQRAYNRLMAVNSNHIKSVFSSIADVGKNLVQGLWNGINNAKDWVIDKIKGFGDAILDGIKSFFGIHSPSREMAEIGKYLAEGLGVGIEDNEDTAVDAANKLSENVLTTFDDLAGDVAKAESDMFNNGVKVAAEKKITLATNMDNTAIGDNLKISGIDGLSSIADKFIDRFASIGDKLYSAFSVGAVNGVNSHSSNINIRGGDIVLHGVVGNDVLKEIDNRVTAQIDEFADAISDVVPAF